MSDASSPESDFSGIDLARSFLPDWAKPTGPSSKHHSPLVEQYGNRSEDPRSGGRGERRDRKPGFDPRGRRPERGGGRREENRGRSQRQDPRREERERPAVPLLTGWETTILPDPRGIDGLAKQLKSGGKAYPLFDLAFLILEKPERFSVELRRTGDGATTLFQFSEDGSLWLREADAIRHVLARHLEKYYRREQIQTEPPKGAYSCVAVCGMSDTLLGPPNYHDYQPRLRRLHAERFSRMSFEDFKSRVRMVKDPEILEKWKTEQSTREEFQPLESPEGEVKLPDMAAVERHFRANHAATISPVSGEVRVAGSVALHHSDPSIRQAAQRTVGDLRRFPLPLAHTVGQGLASKGLQIFKAHENITYVSVARPRHLDRQVTPVAATVSGILDCLESHATVPRAEQWKALVALRSSLPEESAREAAVIGDLSWLIHQGHVVDYARRGLEVVRKPRPKPGGGPTPPVETP